MKLYLILILSNKISDSVGSNVNVPTSYILHKSNKLPISCFLNKQEYSLVPLNFK